MRLKPGCFEPSECGSGGGITENIIRIVFDNSSEIVNNLNQKPIKGMASTEKIIDLDWVRSAGRKLNSPGKAGAFKIRHRRRYLWDTTSGTWYMEQKMHKIGCV